MNNNWRRRWRDHLVTDSLPQWPRAGQNRLKPEARSQGLHPGLCCGYKDQTFEPSAADFLAQKQGAGLKMGQLGLKSALIRNAGITGGGLTS